MSAIRARYGQGSVGPAALVGPDGLEAKRRGESHWGPEAERYPLDALTQLSYQRSSGADS